VSEVVLSELAEIDLIDIWVFVARDNVEAADRLVDQLHDKCRFLANSPKVGHQRPELDAVYREINLWNVGL
jgi:toxin ParE1/3/4